MASTSSTNEYSGLLEALVTVRQTNEVHVSALAELKRAFTSDMTAQTLLVNNIQRTNEAHVSALAELERAFTAETVSLIKFSNSVFLKLINNGGLPVYIG